MQLTTDRLILRQFREADLDEYARMCADPEVMQYLSASGAPMSRADAWRQMAMFAGHWALRGYGTWAIEERATGRFVGRAGLHYPEGWPDREVGWTLAREFWGRGFATEAARAAVAHAFDTLGWDHLVSLILPGNERSVRVAERLGARFDRAVEIHGVPHDLYMVVRR